MATYSKVIYNGETLIDLTEDTVTPGTLAAGVVAHAANGERIVGTLVTTDIDQYLRSVSCTLLADNWTQSDDGKYVQSISVDWMTESWRAGLPILESSMLIDDDYDIQEAFECVDAIVSDAGELIFVCYYSRPEVDFTCIVSRFVI